MVLSSTTLKIKNWSLFELVRIKPPFTYFDSKPNEACFLYLCKGKLRAGAKLSEFMCEEKEAMLLRCGNNLGDILPEHEEFEALVAHFYPEMIQQIFKDGVNSLKDGEKQHQITSTHVSRDEAIEKIVDSILFYFNNPMLADEELLSVKFKELILILLKIENNSIVRNLLNTLFDPVQLSLRDIVEEYIYSDIPLDRLAYFTGRSLSTFKRDFKKYFHSSPSQYIKKRKLEKAAQLLIDTDLRVSEILVQCGFTNLSHFTKIFSEMYHQSPTGFRLSQRAN